MENLPILLQNLTKNDEADNWRCFNRDANFTKKKNSHLWNYAFVRLIPLLGLIEQRDTALSKYCLSSKCTHLKAIKREMLGENQ